VGQKWASAASLTVAPIAVAVKRRDIPGLSAVEQQGIPGFRAEWVGLMDAGQMETLSVAVESEFFDAWASNEEYAWAP
jgi:hypothetical protein